MVEYVLSLDNVFSSLADGTRRDILRRVTQQELSVSDIARSYDLSFAAVSKHIQVLERARLISKRRRGKEQLVVGAPTALSDASEYLEWYMRSMESRLDGLEQYLKQEEI